MPRLIYFATTIPTLNVLGVVIIIVFRSAKMYRLTRNRGKTMETPGYNAVLVCTWDRDDVYMEEANSTQHEENLFFLTGVEQKQDHEVEAMSAFPVLRLVPPVTTQV